MKDVEVEERLLLAICPDGEDRELRDGTLTAATQIAVIGNYCTALGISIADMVRIGQRYDIDSDGVLIKDLTAFFYLSFAEIMRKVLERGSFKPEELETMISQVAPFHAKEDTFYSLQVNGTRQHFGGRIFAEMEPLSLELPCDLRRLVDKGSKIRYINGHAYGNFVGIEYNLSAATARGESVIILRLLREAAYALLLEPTE